MLKRILAAMILVILAAPATHAQYGRRGGYRHEPTWFDVGLQNTRNIVPDIMASDRMAMADIDRRYARDAYDERRLVRERYEHELSRRNVPLGPYVMGRRHPWDSCGYSWNSRHTCRDYEAEIADNRLDDIDERYRPRPQPRLREEPREDPVPPAPKEAILVNLTGCQAAVDGKPLAVNGHMATTNERIFVEVDSSTCDKYLDTIGEGVIALKCR
jgi:hypothetical protein